MGQRFLYITYTLILLCAFRYTYARQGAQKSNLQSSTGQELAWSSREQHHLQYLDSVLPVWQQLQTSATAPVPRKFAMARAIAQCYQQLGMNIKAVGFYQEAEKLLRNPTMISRSEQADFYAELGNFYYTLSNNKLFKNNLLKAAGIWEKEARTYAQPLIETYGKLINNYLEYGAVNNARLYVHKLESLDLAQGQPAHVLHQFRLTRLLYQLRIALAEQQTSHARKVYLELKQYFTRLHHQKAFLPYYADATNFYAEAIFNTGSTGEALQLLGESIRLHQQIGDDPSLVATYSYYSYLARELGDYATAHQSIDEAVYIIASDNFSDLAGLYTSKGIIYYEEKKFEKAAQYFDKAHQLIKRIDNADFYLLSYNIEISKKYFEMYEKTGLSKLLQQSFASYQYSVKQFQDFYENDFFNPLLATFKDNITEGLLQLGIQAPDKLVEIVEMIENIQSRFLLKNHLLNSRLNNLELVNELSEIKTLQLRLASRTPGGTRQDRAHLTKLHIKNQIAFLEKKLLDKYPNFQAIFNPTFKLKEFLAGNHTDILRFYVANNKVYGVHIQNARQISIRKIGAADELTQRLNLLSDKLHHKKPLTAESQYLFRILIRPFALKRPALTIISNSFLNKLPFELLLDEQGAYMVAHYHINYSVSLPLYAIQQKHSNKADFRLAVFRPGYADNDKHLPELPFAEKEAVYLQQKFQSTLFSGRDATKANFRKHAGEYSVYHLPMHAIIDDQEEDVSRLIFDDEDYYFSDFYAQNLPLDMVVLSACETGVGKHVAGEGIMSLSRAFTYSGVAATVHSLWEMPDKQAFEVMQLFYDYLSKGYAKSEALQAAKRAYLTSSKAEELRHPYYWSGFVLHGNAEALITNRSHTLPLLMGVLVLVAGLLLFLKFRQ